jgi:hypothetical protein
MPDALPALHLEDTHQPLEHLGGPANSILELPFGIASQL